MWSVVFQAVLRVPEGDSVTATGSSKKIAKNIAAKLMLDKLDSKKTPSATQEKQIGKLVDCGWSSSYRIGNEKLLRLYILNILKYSQ